MYTITFYSFKGGVGRTLALVNAGVELARRGRRVLLVDFDLEAPGIDTFELLKPANPQPGVVEYVSAFASTLEAPDVRDFCYRVDKHLGDDGGELWVMPAGRGDAQYGERLAAINWQRLYSEADGFLMVEDLKAQWEAALEPDYVLVDSRTGHTDVAGICTRQLPDAVVALFFPNAQNLAGLKSIVGDIRSESVAPRKNNIGLHFVMSNVPDLDDEDEILRERMAEFSAALAYDTLDATIHRYDSLALLNQVVFTAERPKSRLAREYRELTAKIIDRNLEDRDAAIRRLDETLRGWRSNEAHASDDAMREILRHHSNDGQVLFRLALVQKQFGNIDESLRLIEKSIAAGMPSTTHARLERAELRVAVADLPGAAEDLAEVLNSQDVDLRRVLRAIRLLRRVGFAGKKLAGASAIQALSVAEQIKVSEELRESKEELSISLEMLLPLLERNGLDPSDRTSVVNELMMKYIGLGRPKDAIELVGAGRRDPTSLPIYLAFNAAMAEWGLHDCLSTDLFAQVVKCDTDDTGDVEDLGNYNQCVAIALWAVGRSEEAMSRLAMATKNVTELLDRDFSCWRYLRVPAEEFQDDCAEIKRMMAGEQLRPRYQLELFAK